MVISVDDPNDISYPFTSTATDLIDTEEVEKYMNEIRSYLPTGMEEQFFHAGVAEIASSYSAFCYMTDVAPKECAEKLIEKLGVKQ